jgi:hypothetical protein
VGLAWRMPGVLSHRNKFTVLVYGESDYTDVVLLLISNVDIQPCDIERREVVPKKVKRVPKVTGNSLRNEDD